VRFVCSRRPLLWLSGSHLNAFPRVQHTHRQIFSIHAKKWNPPLPERLVTEVADMCVGYCGADLKVMHHPMHSHCVCVCVCVYVVMSIPGVSNMCPDATNRPCALKRR
jgi:hypothetical protein